MRKGILGRVPLLLAVITGLLLAMLSGRTPSPAPAGVAASVFSAGRAAATVRAIAQRPHPVGSAENRRVRDRLLIRMQKLGLNPVVLSRTSRGVRVDNILGRLNGSDRSAPALLLMAHYDSAPEAPGAADDGAGVAAMLETMRALSVNPAPRKRDVLLLLTDGEEPGLLGARAAFAVGGGLPPIGFVMNVDTRGAAGRAQMFETGIGDGETIRLFAREVVSPAANSIMHFVSDRMHNSSDFRIAKERLRVPGLNFAFIGDYAAYHSPADRPERLSLGSLQHVGDTILTLSRVLALAPSLPGSSPNLIYGDLFGRFLVVYPVVVGWVVLAAGFLMLLVVARRERMGWRAVTLGAIRLAGGAAFAAAVLLMLPQADGVPDFGLREMMPWIETGAALLIAAAILLTQLPGSHGRASSAGGLALGLVGACLLQVIAPEAAPLLAWPATWGAFMMLTTSATGRVTTLWAVAGCALGVTWVAGAWHLVFQSVGLLAPSALAVGALLMPLVLYPLLATSTGGGDKRGRPSVAPGAARGAGASTT